MTLFTNLLISGLWVGLIYAAIAATLGIIFRTSGVFHFAHGAIYALAGYGVSLVAQHTGSGLVHMLISIAGGCVAGALIGWLVNRVVYEYLHRRQAGKFTLMVGSLGVSFMITSGLGMAFGLAPRSLDFAPPVDGLAVGKVVLLPVQVWGAPLLLALLLGLWAWYERSAFGRRARAIGSDPDLAEALGVSARRTVGLAFAGASAALAVPALLVGLTTGVTTSMGDTPVLFAFMAIIFGGLRSYWGWVGGGVVVGVVQSVSGYWVPTVWTLGVAFAFVLVVMLWRPEGLGGRRMRYL